MTNEERAAFQTEAAADRRLAAEIEVARSAKAVTAEDVANATSRRRADGASTNRDPRATPPIRRED
ncbi:MAG: hypothetical protein AAFN79_18100 [Pseudomonadota bacterium]